MNFFSFIRKVKLDTNWALPAWVLKSNPLSFYFKSGPNRNMGLILWKKRWALSYWGLKFGLFYRDIFTATLFMVAFINIAPTI